MKQRVAEVTGQMARRISVVSFPTLFLTIGLTIFLGGEAFNGVVCNGKYFLASFGDYIEVSKFTYDVSWYACFFTLVTFIPSFLLQVLSDILKVIIKLSHKAN